MRIFATRAAPALLVIAAASCINGEGLTLPREASRIPEDQLETLVDEGTSGVDARRRSVIRSDAEWAAFWSQVYSRQSPTPPRPAVDFAESIVIVAAMGTRPSGGYAIELEAIGKVGTDYHVIVRETSPGRNCATTSALTQPVVAARVARTDGKVSFLERPITLQC
jgi:hypothetical protein